MAAFVGRNLPALLLLDLEWQAANGGKTRIIGTLGDAQGRKWRRVLALSRCAETAHGKMVKSVLRLQRRYDREGGI